MIPILSFSTSDISTASLPVHRLHIHRDPAGERRGITLVEILVTLVVIAALAPLIMPSWSSLSEFMPAGRLYPWSWVLSNRRDRGSLWSEECWVVFRRLERGGREGMRILARDGEGGYAPIWFWISLPTGISFLSEAKTLMDQKPSPLVVDSALNRITPPNGTLMGGVIFLRTGRIGSPKQGENQQAIILSSNASPETETILPSRATGRVSFK